MDFHPFNPYKLLAHYHRWSRIKEDNRIPPPAIVTLDPVNTCNLRCSWCNSRKVIDNRSENAIRTELLLQIPDFLVNWQGIASYPKGVLAVTIAGGGEPLMHEAIDHLIVRLHALGIDVGLITNGLLIDRHLESLSLCNFVGVSVDAADRATYRTLKGVDAFDTTIRNIGLLTDYANTYGTPLTHGTGRGVGFKYLVTPDNVHGIADAAKTAAELKCNLFHARPADVGWFEKEKKVFTWDQEKIEMFHSQMGEASRQRGIPVKAITDKFKDDFSRIEIPFPKCFVGMMTCALMPSKTNGIRVGLCCDRRGDPETVLIEDTSNPDEIESAWGSEKHWRLCGEIDLSKCPRCTCLNYLKVYYGAVLDDSMNVNLI